MQKAKQGYKLVKSLFGKYEEIPEEWEIKKIKDLTKVSVGLVINPSTYFDEYGTIPMITGKNVTENGIVLDDVDFITEKSNRLLETTRIWSDDLVTMRVGYPGRTSVVSNDHDGINCASVIITRGSKKFVSRFLGYLANSRVFSKQITMHQVGGAQQVVNISSWNEFLIPFPPIQEQQKIVTMLSNVDNLISSYDNIIDSTKKLKTGLMQTLLTRGIGHKKFKKIHLYPKSIIVSIPETWNPVKISDLCKIVDTPHYTSPTVDDGIPVITTADCKTDGQIDYSNVKFTTFEEYEERRKTIDPDIGEVLFTREAPLGIAVYIDRKKIAIGQRIILLKHDKNKIIGRYLLDFLNSYLGKLQSNSFAIKTTVERVNISDIRRFMIPLPPIQEQNLISSITINMNFRINEFESKKFNLEQLKKGLMQKLLTGQIRVKV